MLYFEKIQVQLPEACFVIPPLACVEETNLKSLESPYKAVRRGTMSPVKVLLPTQNSNTAAGAFPDHLLNQVYYPDLGLPKHRFQCGWNWMRVVFGKQGLKARSRVARI